MNNSNNIVISNKPLRVGFLWSTRVFFGFASSDKIWFPCTCVCVRFCCFCIGNTQPPCLVQNDVRVFVDLTWVIHLGHSFGLHVRCDSIWGSFEALVQSSRLSLSLFLSDHHRNPSQFTHIRLSGQRETLNRIGFQHGFSSWGHNQHLQKVSCSNLEHSVMLGALCQKKRVCL